MSSLSSTVDFLRFVGQEMNIYLGLFICITGIFGGLLNIIVFTTLRTFRETTCGTYLTAASICNLGQSLTVIFRVFNTGFNYGPFTSTVFCKFRFFAVQYFALVSMTCMCLATIDQFLSTTKYRHLNNMQSAFCHVILTCIIWFVHGIPTFIYYDSNGNTCISTNNTFAKYFTYFYLPILLGLLPIMITSIFSLMTFFKTLTNAGRQVNIIRLSRERQLTAMTLVHALFITITTTPYVICFVYINSITTTDATDAALNQLVYVITSLFGIEGFAVSSLILKREREISI